METMEQIQALRQERADLQARVNQIPVDGSLEVKTIEGEEYIYARKRIAGKNTSKYIARYEPILFQSLQSQLMELRELRKKIRHIDKQLSELGYEEADLSARVMLNLDFARANIKALIFDQAVLEGISATFPQTEEILENGIVRGVTASDVQKILNLKRAWEFVLDKDVIGSPTNFAILSHIAGLVNEGFYTYGKRIRNVPVRIGGSSYLPPIPDELTVKEEIQRITKKDREAIDNAIDLALYCMKTKVFIDGNKRVANLFANHYLIAQGEGLLVVPEHTVPEFKQYLIDYYEDRDTQAVQEFLRTIGWVKM